MRPLSRLTTGKSQLYAMLSRIEPVALEAVLGASAENILAEVQGATKEARPQLQGVALDGKTSRDSKQMGAEMAHLLSTGSHGLGITLAQVGVDAKNNEIPLAAELLQGLLL